MSKEQTALEILMILIENNVTITREHIENLLTKDQQQREELVKAVAVESFEDGYQVCLREETFGEEGKSAEQYYNEVIKPKYLK